MYLGIFQATVGIRRSNVAVVRNAHAGLKLDSFQTWVEVESVLLQINPDLFFICYSP